MRVSRWTFAGMRYKSILRQVALQGIATVQQFVIGAVATRDGGQAARGGNR